MRRCVRPKLMCVSPGLAAKAPEVAAQSESEGSENLSLSESQAKKFLPSEVCSNSSSMMHNGPRKKIMHRQISNIVNPFMEWNAGSVLDAKYEPASSLANLPILPSARLG